jgi:hypothetical protein
MAARQKREKLPMPPLKQWAPVVALGWLVPGGGHLLLRRTWRGVLILFSVTSMFLIGIMMRGVLFRPRTGGMLDTIIHTGGFLSDLASGILYLFTVWMGYAQPDMAGHAHDYGTKFIVVAGLLNVLAMVDAYEIAAGRKS